MLCFDNLFVQERARNQEANELLSMHMIIENNKVT